MNDEFVCRIQVFTPTEESSKFLDGIRVRRECGYYHAVFTATASVAKNQKLDQGTSTTKHNFDDCES